jgi:two-component system sensor histidine kinase QseC
MSSTAERRARSLRSRLGWTQALTLGGVLLALFVMLDWRLDSDLYQRFDAALLDRARAVAAFANHHDPSPNLQRLWPGYSGSGHEDFFELYDQQGNSVLRSESAGERSLTPPPDWPAATPVYYDLTLPDGHSGRAVALRLPEEATRWLVVAAERESVDALERTVHLSLLGGTLLALLLALTASWWSIRRGLRPLDAFANVALAHAGNPAAGPLPVHDLPAELQPIGHTLERAFEQSQRLLQQERRFARDVAHELRTPLAEIRALADAAAVSSDPAQMRQLIAEIALSAQGLAQSVGALLSLARVEAGLEQCESEPLELVALIEQCLRTARNGHAERQIERELPEECWVSSDPALLAPLLANLIGNAVEYALPGSAVCLQLSTTGAGLVLEVSNPAAAIDADDLAQLGRAGVRLRGPTGDHAGRGLLIARGLAAALGLELTLALRETRFVARLAGLRPV